MAAYTFARYVGRDEISLFENFLFAATSGDIYWRNLDMKKPALEID